jgi:L-aminopeptidase/D-esterase-like protein
VGARGAGCSASIGQIGSRRFQPEQGGQGCAVGKIGDATIGVFTVLNPLGGIYGRQGQLLRGFLDRETGQRRPLDWILRHHPEELGQAQGTAGSHTTITAVIVDRAVPAWDLRQLGRQVHAAMAQAIRPFHTPLDGDVLFAVSTGREPLALPAALAAEVGSQLALDAIYSAIPG